MSDLYFGTGAYRRDRGHLPRLPVVNFTVEKSETSESGIVLVSRMGLRQTRTIGGGPSHSGFQRDGIFNGDLFVVSGTKLYRGSSLLGEIDGTGIPSWAASPYELLVCRGNSLWSYNGTDLVAVDFPDNKEVYWVCYLAGYFIAGYGVTNQFNFSAPLSGSGNNGRSWDGLDFANAENQADPTLDALIVDDVLVLFGSESVEFWPKTGNADLPFAPTEGRTYQKGIVAHGATVNFDNTFAFVGNEKLVYVGANVPQRISDETIEERLSSATSYKMFAYYFEGVEYLVLRLDTSSWVFSAASRKWSEFQTKNKANWLANWAVSGPQFGDAESPLIFHFEGYSDPNTTMERRFASALPLSAPTSIDNLMVITNPGDTTYLASDYAEPLIEYRSSRDQGRTWSKWRPKSLGRMGEYRKRIKWNACGQFDSPGAMFEFRITDPVDVSIRNVKANEPSGGRSR